MSAEADRQHGEEVRARLAAASTGPWRWRNTGGAVYLFAARNRVVMAFRRMGMAGAQPQMIREPHARLVLDDLGRENIYDYPDANLIAHAPDDLARLLARAEKAEQEAERLAGKVARVEALLNLWDEKAGPLSRAWSVYGPQNLSVPFAVQQLNAALADQPEQEQDR